MQRGDRRQPGELGGSPPPLAGDHLEAVRLQPGDQPPLVAAVHPLGELAAAGTRRAFGAGPRPDPHLPAGDLGSLHGNPGQVRQEETQADPMTA